MVSIYCSIPGSTFIHTEVIGTLLDHAAVNFPQTVAGVDDLHGVRDDLVTTQEILHSTDQPCVVPQRAGMEGQAPNWP